MVFCILWLLILQFNISKGFYLNQINPLISKSIMSLNTQNINENNENSEKSSLPKKIKRRNRRKNYEINDEIDEIEVDPNDVKFAIRTSDDNEELRKNDPATRAAANAINNLSKDVIKSNPYNAVASSMPVMTAEDLQNDLKEFQMNDKISNNNLNNNNKYYNSDVLNNNDHNDDILTTIKGIFSNLLIADFFAIIIFLVWFIAASVQKEALGNAWLLERFQDIFAPVIQPALGFLMLGSIASGIGGGNENKEEDK